MAGIKYKEGCFYGIDGLREYEGAKGAIYYIGANNTLELLYKEFLNRADVNGNPVPRYEVNPLMNMNRSYGLEIRDGKFCILTAELLVERILKW